MNAVKNFRKWWMPPRKVTELNQERKVTFLELFYDLVYVVLIARVAHELAHNLNINGLVGFVFLYVVVWWAWFNGSLYFDLHGNNDIRTRVFTFLQMFAVGGMAVFAHDALGEGAAGFAISYAAFQLILTYLWWRTGVHDPNRRPVAYPYTLVFLFNSLLFFTSAFVPEPWRFYLWGIALLVSLLLPFFAISLGRLDPATRKEIDRMLDVSDSLVERFGLITIIVMGEVVADTILGVADHHNITWMVVGTAVLGMMIAIGLWWVYFDFISDRQPHHTRRSVARWYYLHLPMTMGITAAGAAIFDVVEFADDPLQADVRWLLVAAVALALLCTAGLMRTIQIPTNHFKLYRFGGWATAGCALLIFMLGFTNLAAIPLLLIIVLLLQVPILSGIRVWIVQFDAQEFPL